MVPPNGPETTIKMTPRLSVVICTHNPRIDYLLSTLDGLSRQTLQKSEWEFLLVDNCSTPALAAEVDLVDLPYGRIIREEELGLTPARQRGFLEAQAELVLYVDDDSVLDEDYLSNVLCISGQWPRLGAWGAGELRGRFEIPPPEWMIPHLWVVTVHKVSEERWTSRADMDCFPPGAGLAVRKVAAQHYFDAIRSDPFRKSMDRRGNNLSSCGDMDLLWTLTEHGWGVGRFPCLKLDHLIAPRRLEIDYFERLVANQRCSNVLLQYLHGVRPVGRPESLLRRFSRWRYEQGLGSRERWLIQAERRGSLHAAKIINEIDLGNREVRQDL